MITEYMNQESLRMILVNERCNCHFFFIFKEKKKQTLIHIKFLYNCMHALPDVTQSHEIKKMYKEIYSKSPDYDSPNLQ